MRLQLNTLDSRACAVTGCLTLPLEGLGATCSVMDDDMLLVGTAEGSALSFRFRGLNSTQIWPASGMRPTRLLKGSMSCPVEAVALDRSADTAVLCYKGEAWVYEVSRSRVLSRIAMPTPTCVCRAAAVVDGGFIAVCGDDSERPDADVVSPASAQSASGLQLPILAVYRSDGSLYKHTVVPAAIRVMHLEHRSERWGNCLVTGDAQGVVSFYNPLRLEVGAV
jgi:hypothetical protein